MLALLSQNFDLAVYSLGHPDYLRKILLVVDPDNKLFKKVLSRDDALEIKNTIKVKDLRLFAKCLK